MKWKLILVAAVFMLLPSLAHAQSFVTPAQHSAAYETHHVFSGKKLYNMTISFHTAAYRTLMIFDAAAVPGDGAVVPLYCFEGISQSTDSTESFKSLSFVNNGLIFQTRVAVTVSTSTSGCTTLTSDGSNDWFSAQVGQ